MAKPACNQRGLLKVSAIDNDSSREQSVLGNRKPRVGRLVGLDALALGNDSAQRTSRVDYCGHLRLSYPNVLVDLVHHLLNRYPSRKHRHQCSTENGT